MADDSLSDGESVTAESGAAATAAATAAAERRRLKNKAKKQRAKAKKAAVQPEPEPEPEPEPGAEPEWRRALPSREEQQGWKPVEWERFKDQRRRYWCKLKPQMLRKSCTSRGLSDQGDPQALRNRLLNSGASAPH